MTNVVKIEMPIEEVIEGTEKEFNKDKWLIKEANNVVMAVEFAVEDIVYRFWFKSEEFKKSKEALIETGKYEEATYISHMTTAFSPLEKQLRDNARAFDREQEATKEVIEKIVRPIGKKVVAELGIDNEFMPTMVRIYALK